MGSASANVRTCRCAPFPYLGNGWTDCAEICYVLRDTLAKRFTKVDGTRAHVQLYPEGTSAREHVHPFSVSRGTTGRTALKFGV